MKRSERRRFESEFKKILTQSGDSCTICGSALTHNCKTFGGFTSQLVTVLVSDCCVKKVEFILCQGVYVTRNKHAVLKGSTPDAPKKRLSHVEVSNSVESIQSYFGHLDRLTKEIGLQAGLSTKNSDICLDNNPWKSDDARWFKLNPDRSHRLRPMHEGEADTIPSTIMKASIPPMHCWQILVRQVEPGKRVRSPFCRNTEVFIPDEETFLHALFDAVANPIKRGVINAEDLAKVVASYDQASRLKPN